MTFSATEAQEICDQADVVLERIKPDIVDGYYAGEYFAAYCYRVAAEEVAART